MKKAASGIVARLRRHGYEAYFAGGWVRDHLIGRRAKDIDIATSAPPAAVLEIFPAAKAIGAAFGVMAISRGNHNFEVATFRCDHNYRDGRHPEKVTFSSAREDARRRDFTINGLFFDPQNGKILDFVGGEADIRQKIIRAIGVANERFQEDRLRVLRAVRFACDLGFQIEPATWTAIQRFAPDILIVSQERIRDEVAKILTGPQPDRGLSLLLQSGLLARILPEIAPPIAIKPETATALIPEMVIDASTRLATAGRALAYLDRRSLPLALAALFQIAGQPDKPCDMAAICRRLKMSRPEIALASDLMATRNEPPDPASLTPSARLRLLAAPHIEENLALWRTLLQAAGQKQNTIRRWQRELRSYRVTPPAAPFINGDDMIALGYAPGPQLGRILREINTLQYDGVLTSRDQALAYIHKKRLLDDTIA